MRVGIQFTLDVVVMSSLKTHRRFLPLLIAMLLGFVGAVVPLPQQAVAAEGHPYTTPGKQTYNGREWKTDCNQYSTTVERCRAEIFATQVRVVNGKYTFVNEYVFNNLTYLPSNRDDWKSNPLAQDGQFIKDDRVWKTSCFDEWTGANGCRSFIFASVIEQTKTASGWSFKSVDKWVFNNVVQFTPIKTTPPPPPPPVPAEPYNPCNADVPAGWTFTSKGRPHLIKPGYTPTDHYNPISLANFIKLAVRSTTVKDADRACYALLGANELMKQAETRTFEGRDSLWFPYPFTFSANPAMEDLPKDWNSGLGQAAAMTAFLELSQFVGEDTKPAAERHWYNLAAKAYNSYLIPIDEGGFTNRNNGFLWFEEYPTSPEPTVVNNGHHQAVLGLHTWWKKSGDQEALDLFKEAVGDLSVQIPKSTVPLEGGKMSSYDMLRGFPTTPLRAVSLQNGKITETLLNGQPLTTYPDDKPRHDKNTKAATLPLGTRNGLKPEIMTNPHMDTVVNKVPAGWRAVNGDVKGLRGPDEIGMIGVHPNGKAWAGLEQVVPASAWNKKATAGSLLSFAMDSRLEIKKDEAGTGGKVAIYSVCPAPGNKTTTALIHENAKNRSQQRVSWSTSDFKAPAANCDIKVQLLTYSYTVTNTTAWYKNVSLRPADSLGKSTTPAYDLLVHRTATNKLTIKGAGKVAVEAYYGGRWLKFAEGNLTADGLQVTVPERYTGRNINYNYNDGHISELQLISCYATKHSLDQAAAKLENVAKDWSAMSTKPLRDFSDNRLCDKVIPKVLDMAGEPMFVEPEIVPMSEVPSVMPTTMALPDELTLEVSEDSEDSEEG